MLLTISTTHSPATDLGFLLYKHPERVQAFELPFGEARVFYPEAEAARCTVALMLRVDPVGLVRRRSPEDMPLAAYVSDRPYVASSFFSVAIVKVFRNAMQGECKERPELAVTPLPLEARLSVVPARGGEEMLRRLFEPLGYEVACERLPLDEQFPEWGESRYVRLALRAQVRLAELLTHLYVLLPVLDDAKHYWVGEDEVAKLLRRGEGWLPQHPERELITRRYLRHSRPLAREALERLIAEDAPEALEAEEVEVSETEEAANPEAVTDARSLLGEETQLSLNQQRLGAVVATLKAAGAARVLDLGCGEGKLLARLLKESAFTEIVGVDVSIRALEIAKRRLRFDRLPPAVRQRVRLLHGSLMYRDARIADFDAAAVVEVIEHLDEPRLHAFARALFGAARPKLVVLTTPNREYNVRFETLHAGAFRHADHRFEWTRAELRDWASGVADAHGYHVRFEPIGPEDPEIGAPTQMAVFTLA